jgi:hypothetical protein
MLRDGWTVCYTLCRLVKALIKNTLHKTSARLLIVQLDCATYYEGLNNSADIFITIR